MYVRCFILVMMCGCAGGLRKTVRAPANPLELTTAFVYPIRFLGASEPGWRSFELAERMLQVGVREGGERVAFFGPTEFKVLRFEADDAWRSTTALPLLTASGSRADQGVVIRTTIERRVMSTVHEAQNSSGRGGVTSTQLTTYIGRLEVMHPSTQQTLFEAEGQVTIDPFAEPTPEMEYDPAPPLTALVERLMIEATSIAVKHSKSRDISPDFGWSMAVTPQTALSLRTDPALAAEALQLDALQTEVLLENVARVLTPVLQGRQLAMVVKSPPGVAVVSAPASSRVTQGDLIETVDGAPALPHVLSRGRFKGAPLELRVRRADGSTHDLVWPYHDASLH